MEIEVGSVLTGKVTAIAKFGAFVEVAPGKSGLVHISEIAGTYVSDVAEHLAVGQEVTVKVLGTDGGKINLSIKQTLAPPPPRERAPQRARPVQNANAEPPDANAAFEDKLRRFMQDSDSKNSGARGYNDKKGKRRGR